MVVWLKIAQLIVAVLLIISILMQSRGAGLSGVFGGSNAVFRTKRGIEKTLFTATIVLAVAFFALAIALLVFSK
jgi:preprotein translocase subunit SecG